MDKKEKKTFTSDSLNGLTDAVMDSIGQTSDVQVGKLIKYTETQKGVSVKCINTEEKTQVYFNAYPNEDGWFTGLPQSSGIKDVEKSTKDYTPISELDV